MIITFCGHDNVPDFDKVKEWLRNVLDRFIYEENVVFYLGDYGGFLLGGGCCTPNRILVAKELLPAV